jgi:uncharacterized membrane protein
MIPSIIVAVLAIPVLAVVAIIMAAGSRDRIRRLEFRIASLEARFGDADATEGAPSLPAPREVLPASKATTAAEAVPPPPEALPAPAARPALPKVSLEERFGTQWVVWAGGIALALGGLFLVRQAIEQGWFGELQRVLLGAVVALVLIAAGEWTRRREILTGLAGLPKAHIPSVLTARWHRGRLEERKRRARLGRAAAAVAVFLLIVFNLGINNNPMVTGQPVGGRFVNLLLLA